MIKIKKGWIYEAIATTSDPKSNPNAAPMGFYTDDLSSISLKIHKTCKTYENVCQTGKLVINLTDDFELMYKSLFSKQELTYKFDNNVPILEEIDNYLILKLLEMKGNGPSDPVHSTFNFEIEKEVLLESYPLVNRANHLILETLIKAVKPFDELTDVYLKENFRVVKKVAPESKHEKLIQKILDSTINK
ncbi:MAG: DUF447 domain-containing protein [Candidatus Aenigmatarchaeota archaeon]